MNALATLASDGPAAETITPGVLGFLAVAGIGVALYFLMKSMRKRLDAIQVEPDTKTGSAETASPETTETAEAASDPAPESPGQSSSSSSAS